jgi:zinc transport system substrate-binding protein
MDNIDMKYVVGIVVAALLLLGGWYAVSNSQESKDISTDSMQADTEKLSVVTSFYPLQFALERIVGDLGVVTNIGEGRDPHDFEPTTQNILAMQKADVVVLQGADFEPWGDDVMERLVSDGVPVVLATDDIELHEGGHHHKDEHEEEEYDEGHEDEHGHTHEELEDHDHEHEEDEHDHGAHDPHTWLDPVLFSQMVAHIAEEVAAIDPENASTYQENASALQAELNVLDTEYKNRLANCELNEVITSHDAFSYVAERYNFEIHSIAGLSTQDTPSATVLAELKEEAEEGIGAILLEQNSVAAYGETLARETGLETLSINPIAYLVPSGENYLTLMQSNLDTFATALKCNE